MKLHASFLLTALICTVVGCSNAQLYLKEKCKEVIDCTRPLEMHSSDQRDLGSIASKKDIDRLCPDMKQRISCIDQHTKQCMARDRQSMFNVLYNGTILFINELCHNESYQKEFLKHAPCMNGVKGDVENCENNYKFALDEIQNNPETTEGDQTLRKICCSFQEYLRCSDHTIRDSCGTEARTFHKNMIDTMAHTLIKEQCSRYPINSEECSGAISLASVTSGKGSALRAPSLLVLSGLLFLLALLQGARRT